MFKTFYQLGADPFRLSPDSRFCFPHPSYRKAILYMRHALQRGEGFIMITGHPGTGKTTAIQQLLRMLKPGQVEVAKLVTSQLMAEDLLRLVAYSFNLNPEGADKAKLLVQLERFLKQQHQQGRRTLLIVDEAQDMAAEALEELRLLTNIQVGFQQLLQIFLVGQEQLRKVVTAPSLEQLQQRLIAATHLDPLDADETRNYIKYRLRRVDWSGDPLFSNEAYTVIHRYSRGVPRQINQICNRLLLHGSIEKKHRLGLADVRIVVEELHHELLLSIDTEDTASWPTDLSLETYEEEPDRQRAATAPALAPAAGNGTHPNGTVQGGHSEERQGKGRRKPPATAAPATDGEAPVARQRPPYRKINRGATVQETANATAQRPMLDDNRPAPWLADPEPADEGAVRPHDRSIIAWLIPAVVLVAGVLLVLFYADIIRTANHTLSSWVSIGMQRIHNLTGPPVSQPHATVPGQDLSSGIVLRKPLTAGTAPIARELEPVMPEASLAEPKSVTAGQEQASEQDTEQDTGQDTWQEPVAPQGEPLNELRVLEAELTRNDLQVERLEDDSLKVKLGSDAMFAINSTRLKETALPALERFASVLRNHEQMTLRIVGHTDSSGAEDYNLYLSGLRARAVADELIRLGLPAADIQSEGRGDLDTRHEILPTYQQKLKRRVEIYIRQAS